MTRLLLQTLAAFVGGALLLGLLLFLPAGTFNYWQAWVFIVVFMITMSVFGVYFSITDPALVERRKHAGPAAEQSMLQKIVITILFVGLAALPVLSALDHRFGWSQVPWPVSWIGDALLVLSFIMFYFVFRVNSYGASNIQVEQDQKVISTGPYAFVRHPMYDGSIVMVLSIPLALGSWWALVLLIIIMAMLVIRILDEEKVLAKDLPGYIEYGQKVRYRLVPYLW
ncbi:MAG: isoprenylcysteine carboxylmethyltransferase family protein [Ktedonobacteraceae bacterium]|nr:isoprenylcysteine carboxylmethyltransferase family protein [Ktedonobacteraceae bacterium]